jgi:3-oxoacyl-[acyl-carrier-protein] synthase II
LHFPDRQYHCRTWEAALAGKSGIANITKFDATPFSTRFAGEVKNFNIEDYLPGKEGRHMDSFIHFGMAAGIQALQDSASKSPKRTPTASA